MLTMPPSRSSRQVGETLILPLLHLHGGDGNDLLYLNHIIIAHYNASYGCGKCLKQAFVSSSALHNHKKVCIRLIPKKSTRGSGTKPSSGGGGDGSLGGPSKATPKKDGKAPAADSQGSSALPASQTSPCHSGRETFCCQKSHKDSKDSGKKKKKKKDVSPARKSSSHKACKDGGCHYTNICLRHYCTANVFKLLYLVNK